MVKNFLLVMLAIVTIMGMVLIGKIIIFPLIWANQAIEVVQEEVSPRELLRKYEWFKDAAASLDQKRANISTYESRLVALERSYNGDPRSKWAREDREQFNLWVSEIAGTKGAYNLLASEYNAQMSKINWAFTNVGMLPKGATNPLPREFKPYIIN